MSNQINSEAFGYCFDMDSKQIIFTFKGTLTQEILADVGTNLRTRYFKDRILGRKIFSVFIEAAQNIYHHSSDREFSPLRNREIGSGMIIIQDLKDFLLLYAGNIINQEKIPDLKERCDYINTLNAEQLREHYKEIRKNPAKGAGGNIGLIDMARKSGYPINYNFSKTDNGMAFFSLTVRVDR